MSEVVCTISGCLGVCCDGGACFGQGALYSLGVVYYGWDVCTWALVTIDNTSCTHTASENRSRKTSSLVVLISGGLYAAAVRSSSSYSTVKRHD